MTYHHKSELWHDTHTEYQKVDGVWFPRTVQFYAKAYRDGTNPKTTLTIRAVEFNRPEHPSEFTPEDIGIVPGVTGIERRDANGTPVDSGVYDNGQFVRIKEYFRRKEERLQIAAGQAPTVLA